jgi:peptidyl-prolyl cis-trans isomerase SurA
MKKRVFTAVAALVFVFACGFQSMARGSVVVDRVVAVVNDDIITLSDLQREEALKKNNGKIDPRLVLEDMIDRTLQMEAAKREGMEVTDKELDDAIADIEKRNNLDSGQFEAALAKEGLTLEQYRVELREQITLSRVFNKFVRSGIVIDEAEARAHYERYLKSYTQPEEMRLTQIFLPLPDKATPAQIAEVKAEAEAVYERAKRGEDFVRLVREVSQGPTAQQDGDLGFMRRDQALSEIQDAVRTLKPGGISAPFVSAGGYNIVRLDEVRTPVKPFEKVKDEITKALYQQKMENTYRSWLQSLRSDAHIENKL